jgi:hypothetical protein
MDPSEHAGPGLGHRLPTAGAPTLRRTLSDPLVPVLLLSIGLVASIWLAAPWIAWLMFAALAGHSLSGSI